MPTADHLGHVHLKVRDLDRAVAFYRDLLGLDVAERHANFAFLSFGDYHHDLALQVVDAPGAEPSGGDPVRSEGGPTVDLYHSAWEVGTESALRAAYEHPRDRGVGVTPVDHRISKALYFDDPDGDGVETYLDTRVENGREEWRGENGRFDPEALGEEGDGDGGGNADGQDGEVATDDGE